MEFAPAYDMVVNSHYLIGGGDQPMALLIGGEYQHKNVSRKALIDEGVSWGLKATQVASIVDGKLDLLKEAYETIPPHEYMPEEAYDNVGDYLTNFLNGKTAGNAKAMKMRGRKASTPLPIPSPKYSSTSTQAKCGAPVKSAGNAPCILKPHSGRHRSR
jgi:hypothetical protein